MAITGDTGNGATITFGTMGFTASYRRIGGTTKTRPDVNMSHLGSSDEEYIPGDTIEHGEFEAEFIWDPTDTPPDITDAAETITITYPKMNSGSSAAATLAGTGYIKSLGFPEFVNNTANMGRYTVKWNGDTAPAYTPEA